MTDGRMTLIELIEKEGRVRHGSEHRPERGPNADGDLVREMLGFPGQFLSCHLSGPGGPLHQGGILARRSIPPAPETIAPMDQRPVMH
jgi:hypothetical protein